MSYRDNRRIPQQVMRRSPSPQGSRSYPRSPRRQGFEPSQNRIKFIPYEDVRKYLPEDQEMKDIKEDPKLSIAARDKLFAAKHRYVPYEPDMPSRSPTKSSFPKFQKKAASARPAVPTHQLAKEARVERDARERGSSLGHLSSPSAPAAVPGQIPAPTPGPAPMRGSASVHNAAPVRPTVVYERTTDPRRRPQGGAAIVYEKTTDPRRRPQTSVSNGAQPGLVKAHTPEEIQAAELLCSLRNAVPYTGTSSLAPPPGPVSAPAPALVAGPTEDAAVENVRIAYQKLSIDGPPQTATFNEIPRDDPIIKFLLTCKLGDELYHCFKVFHKLGIRTEAQLNFVAAMTIDADPVKSSSVGDRLAANQIAWLTRCMILDELVLRARHLAWQS